MDIYECQRKAEKEGYDNATFDLVSESSGKRIGAKWLDAYMGLIQLEGQNGFVMVRDIAEHGPFVVENFKASE